MLTYEVINPFSIKTREGHVLKFQPGETAKFKPSPKVAGLVDCGLIKPVRIQPRLCFWLQKEVPDCIQSCWAVTKGGKETMCSHYRAYMQQRDSTQVQRESFREPGDDSGCSHYRRTGECRVYNELIDQCLHMDTPYQQIIVIKQPERSLKDTREQRKKHIVNDQGKPLET